MQRFYFLFALIVFAFTAQAQINEVPIGSNPILAKEAAKEQQYIDHIIQQVEANQQSAEVRDFFIDNAVCLLAGDSLEICVDTVGLTQAGASLTICNPVSFGTATFSDTTCIQYTANTGIEMEFDSLCIAFCDGTGFCDTVVSPIIIHRDNNTITLPATTLNIEEETTVCPTFNLPGGFSGGQIISNNPELGNAYIAGECIVYQSQLFAGPDTLVYEACDNFCVCDTYMIPLSIVGDTLSLPFMDDFSYDGPYPDKQHWLNKDVFVNNTMASNPVSVGFATFDGLNKGGAPHGGAYGSSDVLTSAYLDLSTGSDIYLSFYLEPQGLGDAPATSDSLITLILEYKSSFGNWVEIDTYTGHESELTRDSFTYFSYPINLSQYLFDGFQFRFRNFSKRSGNIDHWHLDYVRVLEDPVNAGSQIFRDVAFTQVPSSILKTYTSMPFWQYNNEELQTNDLYSTVNLYNHFDQTLEIVPSTNQKHFIDEISSGTPVADDQLLQASEANITVGRKSINSTQISNGYNNVQTALGTQFPNFTYLEFERTFTYPILSEEINPLQVPAVLRNNTVTSRTIFDNYFAYDDNTAEAGIETSKKTTQIAMKFHANAADTLKAVQFHFPHIVVNTSTQLFNLKVWVGELDETPEFTGLLEKPLYIDSYTDSLNGFTTYLLMDAITGERVPLAIPAGDFYVGWQQVSDCDIFKCIAIGNDKNNPEGMENVFVDPTGTGDPAAWSPVLSLNPTLSGSLMIRAIVGAGEPEASSSIEDIDHSRFSIFPNPTSGLINVNIENGEHYQFTYQVFNTVGQLLQTAQLTPQIDLENLQNGIYFVKILNNKSNKVFNHKIIITK